MNATEVNIIDAIRDRELFGEFIGYDLSSWRPWLTALRCVYGLPIAGRGAFELVRQCTGRDPELLPEEGFQTSLFLTGRRSGKSRIAAVIGAFEAALAGHGVRLSKGERGLVPIIAPTKHQATIVHNYLRAAFETPLLKSEVVAETRDGFDLSNGISVEVLAGDFRTVRGFTLVAAIIDEACFFGLEAESKVRNDAELIRAVQPGLATTGGRMVVISSPYAKRGWCFAQHGKHYGNNAGRTLVWNCPSRTMNPTLPQSVIDAALAEDMASAKSEYLGEWRDDVGEYLPRAVIEALVVPGRRELSPQPNIRYSAFVDLSGGRGDDAALAIGHREERKSIVDFAKRYKAPFNPHEIVGEMARELKLYGVRTVVGDNYSGDFGSRAFESHGIRYLKSEKPRSALYLELLPRLCSGEIELPDDELMVAQLASLERRTRSGGKDVVDHPPGGHDDLANAVAGVADITFARRVVVGGFGAQ
ncbi:MAG: terminase family protein [Nibricoccus sp.]